jgi:hypothetical protein
MIVCSMCNITRYPIETHKCFGVHDLDGTLVIDCHDQTVSICCGYNSRYDNDDIHFMDGLKKMTYKEFKRRYGSTSHSLSGSDKHLTFIEVDLYADQIRNIDGEIYSKEMIPDSDKEIAVYKPEKEYLLNACDNCIEDMIETGMVDHKEPEYVDAEYVDDSDYGDVDWGEGHWKTD